MHPGVDRHRGAVLHVAPDGHGDAVAPPDAGLQHQAGLADGAVCEQGSGQAVDGVAPEVLRGGEDPPRPRGGLDQEGAAPDGDGQGLLAQDVQPGLQAGLAHRVVEAALHGDVRGAQLGHRAHGLLDGGVDGRAGSRVAGGRVASCLRGAPSTVPQCGRWRPSTQLPSSATRRTAQSICPGLRFSAGIGQGSAHPRRQRVGLNSRRVGDRQPKAAEVVVHVVVAVPSAVILLQVEVQRAAVRQLDRLFGNEDRDRGAFRRPGPASMPHAVSSLPSMAKRMGPVTRFFLLLSS